MTRARPLVVVLDYGSGNLRSAMPALRRVGAQTLVTADRDAALTAAGLLVPGVGAFAACMAGLQAVGGDAVIASRLSAFRPVFGVCVGMQVLFAQGAEHGIRTQGCGAWPGVVERLDAPVLPHMGWNTVTMPAGSRLFDGIGADERFYFARSYAVRSWLPAPPQSPPVSYCWATAGNNPVAAGPPKPRPLRRRRRPARDPHKLPETS